MTEDREAFNKMLRAKYADMALAFTLIPECARCGTWIRDETPGALCEECAAAEDTGSEE